MGRGAEQDVFRWHATSVNVSPQLPNLGRMDTLASWGEQLARALLQEPLPRHWAHVQGVAARARGLAPVLGADADLLEAAAWLHDIGYAPALPSRACISSMAPGTCAMPSTPTPCCAAWWPTTPAPSSKPANADLPTS
jgi:hypothetical protein